MNIAVVYGGISTERNVSIAGGRAVVKALRSKGHNVIAIDPALGADKERQAENLISNIEAVTTNDELSKYSARSIIECVNSDLFDNIDCAFLVLHGKYGEDGMIQSLLELRGIPYTGSNVRASALAMDKITSKYIFAANGIVTPAWELLHPQDAEDEEFINDLKKTLGKNIVIKPSDQGSAIGLSIIQNGYNTEIADAIKFVNQYSNHILAERYIEGRELTVAIIDQEAMPVVEIIPDEGTYDYKHKYSKGHTQYVCPAEIPDDVADFVQNMALAAHNAIGCSCFSRIDFRLDHDMQPFCLEVNTLPGFTETSLVPMAAKANGIEFPDLCEQLIDIAAKK